MTDSLIFDKTSNVLEKAMNISARRHSLLTGNIANIDTIGYEPKDLDFKKTLRRAMEKDGGNLTVTNSKHYKYGTYSDLSGEVRKTDGANHWPDPVDIDVEMTNLVENNIKYRSSVEMLLRKISMLRLAITEGVR